MNVVNAYYHIYSASTDSLSVSRETASDLQKTWLCKECNGPKPDVESVDVSIQEDDLGNGPLNLIWGAGVAIANCDFLVEFGEEKVKNNLWLGRVFLGNGRMANNWVTFRGKHRLIIRGTRNAGYRRCDECGRLLYYAAGSRYLCPSPSPDIDIFESHLRGLVVPKAVFGRVKLYRWSKLNVEKLAVRSNPYDGLPICLG